MKNFRTYQLALELYERGQQLQISNTAVKDQFNRASLSVVLNLAEGSGKATSKDRRRFYQIALGSLRETQALLKILKSDDLICDADRLGGMIYRLLQCPGSLSF